MKTSIGTLILFGFAIAATGAQAQTYPNRTVNVVVTSAAGAATDVLTRAVSQRLSQKWSQSVVVENRGGGGHYLAAGLVINAGADGHTLLSSETGFWSSQPHLHTKTKAPFDVHKEFVPLAGFASIPVGVLVHPSVAKSLPELLARAKEKPGSLNFGTAGLGTAPHTAALLLESLAGIKLTAVHYRGAAPALNDLIAGHINVVIMGPSVALPAIRAGKVNLLAFGSLQRVAQMPDVPTVAESVPGYDASVSFGMFALARTPRSVLAKVNADVQDIIKDSEFHKKFLEPMVVQPIPGTLEGFAEYLNKDSAKWARVIKQANLKIE